MKLSELAVKPKLIKLTVKEPAIIEKYGDELEFYFHDRQPLDVFAKFASVTDSNPLEFVGILQELILDEDGNNIMSEENILPMDVLTEVIKLVSEYLGK